MDNTKLFYQTNSNDFITAYIIILVLLGQHFLIEVASGLDLSDSTSLYIAKSIPAKIFRIVMFMTFIFSYFDLHGYRFYFTNSSISWVIYKDVGKFYNFNHLLMMIMVVIYNPFLEFSFRRWIWLLIFFLTLIYLSVLCYNHYKSKELFKNYLKEQETLFIELDMDKIQQHVNKENINLDFKLFIELVVRYNNYQFLINNEKLIKDNWNYYVGYLDFDKSTSEEDMRSILEYYKSGQT